MLENNQNPVTEVSEQGAVQATVESLNNGMIPQGSATSDSNSSINAVVPNGTASSGTLLSGTVLQNSYLKMWDGEPLSEGKLYHRNEMIQIYSENSLSPLTSTRRRRPMPNLRVMLLRYIRMRIHNITMTCSRPVMLPKPPHIMRMPRNLPGMT